MRGEGNERTEDVPHAEPGLGGLLPQQDRLARTAVRGAGWVVGGRWILRLSNVVCVVVLARALSVHDYGLVAIVNLTLAIGSALGTAGLQAALIPLPASISAAHWHVAWTYERLFIKSALAFALVLFAGPLAHLVGAPGMASVFQVLALCPLLEAAESYASIALTKQLAFRQRCLLEVSDGVVSTTVLLMLISIWASVWVFVIALCAGKFARVVASYVLYPVCPRISLDVSVLRELIPFGKWLFAIQFLTRLRQDLDRMLIVGVLGPSAMAVFSIGSRFSAQLISDVNDNGIRLLMPIYAKMQGRPERIARAYERILELVFLVMVPAGVGLAFVAEPLIVSVFGEKWMAAVPVAQMLSLAATLRIINCSACPLLRGTGTPAWEFALYTFYLVTLFPLAFALTTMYGLVGTAAAVMLAEGITLVPWFCIVYAVCGVKLGPVLRSASWPVISTIAMILVLLALKMKLSKFDPGAELAIFCSVGAGVYVLLMCMGWPLYRWSSVRSLAEAAFGARKPEGRFAAQS